VEQTNFTGNERQLKLLLKAIRENDIPSWNNFVKSSGKYFVANLAGIDLSFINLKEINLKGANLVGSNLEGCNLTRANLERTKLMRANLNNTILTKAIICNSYLQEATLINSDATGADFRESDLSNAVLDSATLENSIIINTKFKNTSLLKTNMKGVKKNSTTRIKPKPKTRVLTVEEKRKLSPWKIAKQEETMRRLQRMENERSFKREKIEEVTRAKTKLNRNIFGAETPE